MITPEAPLNFGSSPHECEFCYQPIEGPIHRHGKPQYPKYRKRWCGRCQCWCGAARSARRAWQARETA